MLRITWTENLINENDLSKMETKRSLISRVRKRQMKCIGHMMREENLILMGKGGREKQRITYLVLFKLDGRIGTGMDDKGTNIHTAIKDRKLWRATIAQVLMST